MEKKKRSLINVIMTSMFVMISLPVILLGGIVLFGDYYFFRQEKEAIQYDYISEQEAIFKHEVEKAIDYIQWTRKQNYLPEEDLKVEMLNWISRIRFHNKGRLPGFLFVRTYEGLQLMSISRPGLIGQDVSRMTDPNGINSHQLLMKAIASPAGGFVDFFNTSASTAVDMDKEALHYSEFDQMARSANKMISQRNQAEQALRDSENRYRSIIIKDHEGRKIGLRSIVRDVERQKKYEENLIYLAYHDALTGLKNRKAFYEQLQDAIYQAKRYGTEIALIYIDIDRFKRVNDTLGHEMGDALLLEIRDRLQGCLRKTDFVSRIGGYEFVVLVDNPHHIHPAAIAEKIISSLSEPYELEGNIVDYVSSSIGISVFPTDAVDMDGLIKKADQAMYIAKAKRNRFINYSDYYKFPNNNTLRD